MGPWAVESHLLTGITFYSELPVHMLLSWDLHLEGTETKTQHLHLFRKTG